MSKFGIVDLSVRSGELWKDVPESLTLPAYLPRLLRGYVFYCQLLSSDLLDKWLVSDNDIDADVFISDIQYLTNHHSNQYGVERTVAYTSDHNTKHDYVYQLTSPITSEKVIDVLNGLSQSASLPALKRDMVAKKNSFSFKVNSALKKFFT